MAVLDVLNLNLGTEQNPNWVLHDLHDKRISTTAVTTATHLLATDASLSAINPMTIANAASVLGVYRGTINYAKQDTVNGTGYYDVIGTNSGNILTDDGILFVSTYCRVKIGTSNCHFAVKTNYASNWEKLEARYLQQYTTLSDLASALGVIKKESVTLAVNGTFQLPGKGIIMTASLQDGSQDSNAIVMYSNYGSASSTLFNYDGAMFSGDKDHSGTVNFYTDNGVCYIQNKWTNITVYYTILQSY